jgi:hypothetical protein
LAVVEASFICVMVSQVVLPWSRTAWIGVTHDIQNDF